jgi:photosystem II stability/assembly factor-like uncharacterized protein
MLVGLEMPDFMHAQTPEFRYLHGGTIHGVHFVNGPFGTIGFTAAEGGRIGFSDDLGATWVMHRTPGGFTSPLRDIHAVYDGNDILHAYAVGDGGVVLKLNPSAETWADINAGSRVMDLNSQPARLTAIHAINEDDLWCVGMDGAFAVSSDGGESWTNVASQSGCTTGYNPGGHDPYDLHDIHFFGSSGYGVVCGEGQWLGITSNGGCTWSPVDVLSEGACPEIDSEEAALGIPLVLRQLAFEDPGNYQSVGYVVGGQGPRRGYVFQKASWSAAWEQVRCYADVELNSSGCATPSVQGVAALASTGTRAITGGQLAQVLAYGPGSIGSFDPCDTACSEEELTTCGSIVLAQYTEPNESGVLFWPALNRVAAIGSTEACLVGEYGRILRVDATQSAGDECVDVGTRHLISIRDGMFVVDPLTGDPSIGYLIGQGRSLLKSLDSGLSWDRVEEVGHGQADLYFTAIDGSSTGSMAIVGTGGAVAYADPLAVGGWAEVGLSSLFPPSGLVPDWSAVSFAPATDTVWAAAATGACIKSTDGGENWSLVGNIGQDVLGLSFGTTSIGFACGRNSSILRTVDSGASWSAMTVTGTPPSTFTDIVCWDSGTKAVAVGTGGAVYELVSGSFTPVSLGGAAVTTDLNDVERVGSGEDLRICGNAGVVLFRDSGTWTSKKSHTNSNLVKLSFPLANEGYAIGGPSYVAAYY